MKLIHKEIDKDGVGSITLLPEELEDMWQAYNLILVGDEVRASTKRRVQRTTNTGSSNSERVRVTLGIKVTKIEFEPEAGLLRLSGINTTENPFVKMGAHHTLDLEMNRKFTLKKSFWDPVTLDRVAAATDPTKYADLAAVMMAEGLAHICLITSSLTIIRARIESTIPRKRKGSSSLHDQGLKRFFESVMQGILRHVDFNIVKCVIVASPGFVKDQFADYMNLEAQRRDIKVLLENKQKFVYTHCSGGHKGALREILSDPAMVEKLKDTKASSEVKALNDFFEMMKTDPDRAFYGLIDIQKANERMAVQNLLLTDELFRSSDIRQRQKYIGLVESVKANGGEVKIFSAAHVSGEQLKQLGGVAAILRFPLPDIDDERDSESDEDPFEAKEEAKREESEE